MDIIFVFLCLVVLYFFQRNYLIEKLNKHNHTVSKNFFDLLFVVHNLFFLLYYLYSTSKRSDSLQYYQKTLFSSSWLEFLGTGTEFIRFLTYPFSHYLHLSFPAISLIFSFLNCLFVFSFFIKSSTVACGSGHCAASSTCNFPLCVNDVCIIQPRADGYSCEAGMICSNATCVGSGFSK